MVDWSRSSSVQEYWQGAGAVPGEPSGLPQAQGRWAGGEYRPESARLGAYDWFGGRNTESAENGWDSEFYRTSMVQYQEQLDKAAAGERGAFFDWFGRPDATGVATWNDPSRVVDAGGVRRGIRAGDVFSGGRWTRNLYDDHLQEDADLLMAKFLFDGDQQARLNESGDSPKAYREAVQGKIDEQSDLAAHGEQAWETAKDIEENVEQQSQTWLGGWADTIGAGMAGAGGGAALGGMFGGPIGAIGGTVVGAVTGIMNQDQFTETVARARVQAEMAGDQEGWLASAASWVESSGKVGQLSISPLQNAYSGIYDQLHGDWSDGTSEFYRVDPATGERTASGWAQTGHVLTSIGDAFLSFGSPGGALAYQASIGAVVLGKGAGLAATDSVWVDEYGDYHNLEGLGEHAAAYGELGIDVLQMGTAGMMASTAAASRRIAGIEEPGGLAARGATYGLSERIGDRAAQRLRGFEPYPVNSTRAPEILSGRKYTFDEAGNVYSSRLMLNAIVPSEAMRWLPATYMARFHAIRQGRGVTQDDLYEAALKVSGTGGRWSDAVLTGLAEGSEEMLQGGLETLSYSGDLDAQALYMQGAYGFASGLGMGIGPIMARPVQEDFQREQARRLEGIRNGGKLPSREEWRGRWEGLSRAQRNRLANASPQEAHEMRRISLALGRKHQWEATGTGLVGQMAVEKYRDEVFEAAYRLSNDAADAAMQMFGVPATMRKFSKDKTYEYAAIPANAGLMTSYRLVQIYQQKLKQLGVALKMEGNTDEETARWTAQQDVLRMVVAWTRAQHELLGREGDDKAFLRRIRSMNRTLLRAVREGEWIDKDGNLITVDPDLIRSAVELNIGRHPLIDAGSIITIVPQVDAAVVKKNMHGAIGIGQAMLKIAQGDYDGDAPVTLNLVDFREGMRKTMRSGAQYATSEDVPEMRKKKDEKGRVVKDPETGLPVMEPTGRIDKVWKSNMDAPDNEADVLTRIGDVVSGTGAVDTSAVDESLTRMSTQIFLTYGSIIESTPGQSDPLLGYLSELQADIRNGDPDSRKKFMEKVLNHGAGQGYRALMDMGRKTNRAELLELHQMVTVGLDNIIRDLNAIKWAQTPVRKTGVVDPTAEINKKYIDEIVAREAATRQQQAAILYGPDGTRIAQHLHYNPFVRAAIEIVLADPKDQMQDVEIELARAFMEESSGETLTDSEQVEEKDVTLRRTRNWMQQVAANLRKAAPDVIGDGSIDISEGMLVWASINGPDLEAVQEGALSPVSRPGDSRISLLQLLLRKSVQIDRARNRNTEPGKALDKRLNTLDGYSRSKGERTIGPFLAIQAVFGDLPASTLIGEDAAHFVGASLTLNQLIKIVSAMGPDAASAQIKAWRSLALYVREGKGDPPYSISAVRNGRINSFTVLIDTIAAVSNTKQKLLKEREMPISESVQSGFAAIRKLVSRLSRENAEEIRQALGLAATAAVSEEDALEYALRYKDLARVVAGTIPNESILATFSVQDGHVLSASWVKEMLLSSSEKAELMLFMEPLIDEFNALGGTLDKDRLRDPATVDSTPANTVDPNRIKSRMLMVINRLASLPSNIELAEFLRTYEESSSLDDFLEKVNKNPMWRGNQPELLAYYDRMSDVYSDPRDIWSPTSGGDRLQLLGEFGKRADLMTQSVRVSMQVEANDAKLIAGLTAIDALERARTSGQELPELSASAMQMQEQYLQLVKAVDRAKAIATTSGAKIRDQFTEVVARHLLDQADKGAADRRLKAMAEWTVLLSQEALVPGVMLEGEKLTSLGVDAVLQNPELLMLGPVRVMFKDGRTARIDLSTVTGILEALKNKGLDPLVRAAVFPTYKDVDTNGVPRTYQLFGPKTSLTDALRMTQVASTIPSDIDGMSIREADEIIAMFEGFAKRRSEKTQDAAERALGYFPVQKMIDELVLAYTTRTDYHRMSASQVSALNQRARIKVAQSLITLAQTGSAAREYTKQVLTASIADRQRPDEKYLDEVLEASFGIDSAKEQKVAIGMVLAKKLNKDSARLLDLQKRQEAAASDLAKMTALGDQGWIDAAQALVDELPSAKWIEDELAEIEARREELQRGLFTKRNPVIHEFETTYRAFEVRTTDASKEARSRRSMLVQFLMDGQNHAALNADKIAMPLMRRVSSLYAKDKEALYRGEGLDSTQWQQLAVVAAKRQIAVSAVRSSSGVIFMNDTSRDYDKIRLWDSTFSYLAEPLFNKFLLEAGDWVREEANLPTISSTEAVSRLMRGIFNENDFGEWNPIVPGVTVQVQKALDGSAVGMTIPVGGSTPVSMFDTAVASYTTWVGDITADHLSDMVIGGYALDPLETWFPDMTGVLKLQNHFVSKIDTTLLEQKLQNKGIDPTEAVRAINAVLIEHPDSEVDTQGFRIMDLAALQKTMLDLHTTYKLADFELTITYVDVDKKPAGDEFANHGLFDGMGRNIEGTGSISPFAAMIFGVGGLSKILQQNPLDFAARGGSAYTAYITSPLSEIEALEARATSVGELMKLKAIHLYLRTYEHGRLHRDDLPGLYKLMKSRHLYQGKDPSGTERLMWAEEVIRFENDPASGNWSSSDLEEIRLSDEMYRLLVGASAKQAGNIITRPEFDIDRIYKGIPDVSSARLERLGLDRLGKEAALETTELVHYTRLPGTNTMSPMEAGTFPEPLQEKVRGMVAAARDKRHKRSEMSKKGKGKYDFGKMSKLSMGQTQEDLDARAMSEVFRTLGIPYTGIIDEQSMVQAMNLARGLDKSGLGINAVHWYYDYLSDVEWSSGVLNSADFGSDQKQGSSLNSFGPMWSDLVTINLTSIMRAMGGDARRAEREAKMVIQQLASTGATLMIVAPGETVLHSTISKWMRQGQVDYVSIAGSKYLFEPLTRENARGRTLEALEDSLVATPVFSAKNATLVFGALEMGSSVSEGAAIVWDERQLQNLSRRQVVVLPTAVTSAKDTGRPGEFSFGIPSTPQEIKEALELFNAILSDPVRTNELEVLAARDGKGKGQTRKVRGVTRPDADPKDKAQYKAWDNGMTNPGIRSFKDAVKKLKDTVSDGRLPIYEGQSNLMAGDFAILKDPYGHYFLYRLGMKIPDTEQMQELFKDSSIATTLPEVEANHTIPPNFNILSLDPDQRGSVADVEWQLDAYAKNVLQGLGSKLFGMPMPADWGKPPEGMSTVNAKNLALITSAAGLESKFSIQQRLNNFSTAFAIAGVDFRLNLVNALGSKKHKTTQSKAFERDWDALLPLLKAWAQFDHGITAAQIRDGLSTSRVVTQAYVDFAKFAEKQSTLLNYQLAIPPLKAIEKGGVDADISRLLLTVLMAPEVKLEHVVSTPGLLTVSEPFGDSGILTMARLFTDALDDRTTLPHVRKYLIKKFNDVLPTFTSGKHAGKPMYRLNNDWSFEIAMRNKNTGEYVWQRGWLTIAFEAHATENPAAYTQAALLRARDGFTPHVANVLGLTLDARMIYPDKARQDLDEMFGKNTIVEYGADPGRDLWEVMEKVRTRTLDPVSWQGKPPMELQGERESLKAIGDFDFAVQKGAPEWRPHAADFRKAYDRILLKINATDPSGTVERMFDQHVRMYLGAPGPMEGQEGWQEQITPEAYLETLSHFEQMLTENRNLMEGGAIPMMAPNLVNYMFKQGKWAPVKKQGKGGRALCDTWDEWTLSLWSQMLDSPFEFDPMFAEELQGVLQLWKNYSQLMGMQGLSLDLSKQLMVLQRRTNEALLSLNPLAIAGQSEPLILDAWQVTYGTLMGNDQYGSTIMGRRESQANEYAKRRVEWSRWKAKNKVPKALKKQTTKDYVTEGAYYFNNSARGSAFFRGLTNMSLITRMADLNIYFSGYIEQPTRNMFEHLTDILTGNYSGRGAASVARAKETGLGQKVMAGAGKVADRIQLGEFGQTFTYQDQLILDALSAQLGADSRWLSELYDEMAYHGLISKGEGRVGRLLEKGATRVSRAMSDPRFGMSQEAVAKRYILAAIEQIHMSGGTVSMAALADKLSKNPMWLQQQYEGQAGLHPHRAGMQRVAQVRSQKQTPLGRAMMKYVDTLTSSTSTMANFAGFLMRIPFMFTRFTTNALSFATGMEGWNQAGAMFFSGRKRPKWLQAVHKTDKDYWDLTDCLETMDLRRSMIRSGVTLTMVFTLGMMAGGKLGLDGEDEEERRRRRMAKYLNLPLLLDPNEPENSFAYADAIFLDSIPGLSQLFKDESGHSVIVPHWVLRQFTSPILGMSRFFETGDFREVGYGFLDAFSVMPNSVLRLFHEADVTAKLLIEQAEESGKDDSPEGQVRTAGFFIQAFSVYEQALFENNFINTLYSGGDRYDRNPWAIPMTDELGNLVLQPGTGLPMQETKGLVDYIDPVTKEVKQAYPTRQGMEGELYHYAENHALFAFAGALFSGGMDSPLLRGNMVPRQRKIALPETTDDRAMAAVLALYEQGGGLETLTKEEIAYKLQADAEANGIWWNAEDIDAQAAEIYANNNPVMEPLSFITPGAEEILTDHGADRIIDGLVKGSITLDSPELLGISMDQEQRDRIGRIILARITQDGIDRGLPERTAKYRAERFYWGDDTTPDIPGIREILYSDMISKTNVIKYNQLNVSYMMGPDGKPWATPFSRRTIGQAFLPFPHKVADTGPGTDLDSQGKVIDEILGINTGLHGIERVIDVEKLVPDDKMIDELEKAVFEKTLVPKQYRRGYGGGGGRGGGGGYAPQMRALPSGAAARFEGIQMINTSNPYIRRSNINRERITSDRGRLKQWQ